MSNNGFYLFIMVKPLQDSYRVHVESTEAAAISCCCVIELRHLVTQERTDGESMLLRLSEPLQDH